jgi:hypothetical protein
MKTELANTRSQVVLEHVGPEFGLYYLSTTLVRGGITSCGEHALPTAARARCSLGCLIALMLCFCGTALPGQVPLARSRPLANKHTDTAVGPRIVGRRQKRSTTGFACGAPRKCGATMMSTWAASVAGLACNARPAAASCRRPQARRGRQSLGGAPPNPLNEGGHEKDRIARGSCPLCSP